MKPAAWVATAAAVDAPTVTLMPLARYGAASQFVDLADLLELAQRHHRGLPKAQQDSVLLEAEFPSAPAMARRLGMPAKAADQTALQKAELAKALREAKARVADIVLPAILRPGALDEMRHRDAVDDHRTRLVLLGLRTDKRCGPSLIMARA